MPPDRLSQIQNGVLQLDIAVRYFVTFLVVSVASFAVVAWRLLASSTHWSWFTLPLLYVVLCFFSFRGAIAKAIDHGIDIEVAYDLHRFDIVEAMRLPLPTPRTEQLHFDKLSRQARGEILPAQWVRSYVHDRP
jgi:hypothetical protein